MEEVKIEGNDVKQPDTKVDENETPDWAKKRISEISAQKNEYKEKYEAMLKEQSDAKAKELEEQGKYQELLTEREKELEVLKVEAEAGRKIIQGRRDALLSKLPEDEREKLSNVELDVLEYIVSKVDSDKKDNPPHTPYTKREDNLPDDWTELSPEDRRKNWSTILGRYTTKK